MIFVSIVLPILAGILLLIAPDRIFKSRQMLINMTAVSFVVCALFPVLVICSSAGNTLLLFSLVDEIPVFFAVDTIGKIFAGIVIFVFLMAGFFSFVYMSHEHHEKRYYGFYLITFGVLMGLCFSGNLVTLYLFYEFMTLVSVPLVLHSGSKEAVMAGLKYLFYSFCGAYMALFGIYFLYKYAIAFNGGYETSGHMLGFVAGGSLDLKAVAESGSTGLCLTAVFLMIVGFGAATLIAGGQKGIEYRDTLLRLTQEGEVRRYAGRLDWKRAEFTAPPDWRAASPWRRAMRTGR